MVDFVSTSFVVLTLGLLGAALGSFAGAQVWRLRAGQLMEDKAEGEPYDKSEYKRLKPLMGVSAKTDRSRCLECGHRLAWYDLLPILSWLSTKGRCRYCKQPIGSFELIIELGMAMFFVLSYLLWPTDISSGAELAAFIVWLVAGVALAILFAYDAKWFLLPDAPMVAFIALAAVYAALNLTIVGISLESLMSLLGAMVAIGGLYGLLYLVSRGRWVGYGDVTLGAGLGLMLGRWDAAIVAVVLANFIGTVIVLPGLLRKTIQRNSQMPFGPLLILGVILAHFWGRQIIDWYLGIL